MAVRWWIPASCIVEAYSRTLPWRYRSSLPHRRAPRETTTPGGCDLDHTFVGNECSQSVFSVGSGAEERRAPTREGEYTMTVRLSRWMAGAVAALLTGYAVPAEAEWGFCAQMQGDFIAV